MDIWRSIDGTDYQDEMFGRTGNQQQYNINVSGGTKQMTYSVSYAHNEEKVSCLIPVSKRQCKCKN